MIDFLLKIAAWVGIFLLSSGALVGVALWFFKLFGEKWLGAKFAERLEAFKHDQQKEIEHLRFEINKLLDRTAKLHQREFEVLPRAWSLLAKSYHSVKSFTSALQTYPDIDRMTTAHLDEFLSESPLMNWQKDELKAASDKNKYYQSAIFFHYAARTRKACRKSAFYLLKNGIFIHLELKEKINKVDELAWAALVEHEMNERHSLIPRERSALDKFTKDGEPLFKEVETEVQKRLWDTDALTRR